MRLANRKLFFISLLCFLLVRLHAQVLPLFSDPLSVHATSRIAAEINDGALQVLHGNRHLLARREFDVGGVADGLPMQSMVLVFQPSEEQAAALGELLQDQHNPASPYFHQWLTPDEFAEHFGASAEDTQRVANWLESHGMRVDEIAPSRRTITFSGNAAQVERTFSTIMRQYRAGGALHVANATDPSIPTALVPVVKGVLSLYDFRVQAMHLSVAAPPISSGHYVTPGDLAVIYNVNPLYTQGVDGRGQSVAVVGRSNFNVSDVRTFRATYGLPANDPQVLLNGADPGTADAEELTEATLDAEYAGALARQAGVTFVASASTSASDGSLLSAQYIVNHNMAAVMTMGFGLCEAALGSAGNAFVNALWQQAAAQGITVLVSAGAAGCDSAPQAKAPNSLAVNGLCSTPYDLCIGGTQFDDTANPSLYWSGTSAQGGASALGYIPEIAWNGSAGFGLHASGAGSSSVYSKPAWQSGTGVPYNANRYVPDLSLAAAGHDGYLIVLGGLLKVVGGTSAATVAMAGLFALVGQSTGDRVGLANATLYSLASQQNSGGTAVFHHIMSGGNNVDESSAVAGFDVAAGLGSVDGNALAMNWSSGEAAASTATPAGSLKLALETASPVTSPLSTASIPLQVTGSGGFKAAVNLAVSGVPAGITAVFSPAVIAAPGSGSGSLVLTVASSVAAGNYSFNVTASGGGFSSTAAATLTVAAPKLMLSASAPSVSVLPGSAASIAFTTAGNSVLNSNVALIVSGLPAGVTRTFSPGTISAPGNGMSILTLTADPSAQAGTYPVVVTANAATTSESQQFTLTVLPIFDIRNYGAKVDGQALGDGYGAWSQSQSDCSMTSGSAVLSCATSHFASTDVGKAIAVYGAGPTKNGYVQPLSTMIASYSSGTSVTLAATASNMVNNSERVVWGTDDTVAIQAAIVSACAAGGGTVYIPTGKSLTNGATVTCSQVGLRGESQQTSSLENWQINVGNSWPVVYFYSPSNTDQSLKGSFLQNLEIRQVKHPSNTNQAFDFYQTYKALADNIRVIGYSYECAIDGGGAHNYGDEIRNSQLGPCGNGGPAYTGTTSAINYNGANIYVHDNTVWGSGQGEEYGGREGQIENNEYDGSTLSGGNQGTCFNLGSTGSGVFNVWFTGNHCKKFLSAVHGGNSIGTMDRIHIENNLFEDSGIVAVAGGIDTNSVVCGTAPATCENDTVVHGVSTIIGNTIISNTVPGGVQVDNATGLSKSASLESFQIQNNTYQVNYAGFASGNNYQLDIVSGIQVWKPSTGYANGSNGYVYPTVLNGYAYNATKAGNSGALEPAWCTTVGCNVTDGTVIWTLAYVQPTFSINGEKFSYPAGLASIGYDLVLDGVSREMLSLTNVSGNYSWQVYLRQSNGRGNMANNINETIPANTPYSDSVRYYDNLPSSAYYAAYRRMPTYFPLGASISRVTSTGVGQLVTVAGWNAPAWVASNSYNADSYIQAPADNGHYYRNLTACTSNSSAPQFPTSAGATVSDNSCIWRESGLDAVLSASSVTNP